MPISSHNRIGCTPSWVKRIGEFFADAKHHSGVALVRKNQIAQWALSMPNAPQKS
ncbi:MAG: polysaccharide deacetylase [Comamonadaceae bacterium]|nr:MAG: polysaccharide deacetylase [Comamonadaceae bacterium]